MSDAAEKLFLEAFAADFPALIVVGEDSAARRFARACAGSAAERAHLIGFAHDLEGWPTGHGSRVAALGGEVTAQQGLRSALRQDPDFLVLEAPREEVPWEMVVTIGETGHGVLVRVASCADEKPVLDALRAFPETATQTLPRIAVLDRDGIARIVDTGSGNPIWRRGDAVLTGPMATGRVPRALTPQPAREPVPPLDPAVLDRLRAALAPLVRRVFVPVLAEPSGDAARSKLAGLPLLARGEEWPRCPSCSEPMPLAVQLAREDLPEDGRAWWREGASHFQFFYCTSTGCTVGECWEGFSKNKLLRFIEGGVPAPVAPKFEGGFSSREIVSWESADETPASEEVPDLGDELREARWRLSDRIEDGDASPDEVTLEGPRAGEKLLGWPRWEQGVEWETCPRCGTRMDLVFQIDADQGPLAMLFAADGKGHVSRCPRHDDVLAFRWACG